MRKCFLSLALLLALVAAGMAQVAPCGQYPVTPPLEYSLWMAEDPEGSIFHNQWWQGPEQYACALPFIVVTGHIWALEPVGISDELSDILVFSNGPGGGLATLYSDGHPLWADLLLLYPDPGLGLTVREIGTEGSNYFVWQAGSFAMYTIYSDVVPEPGTWLLAGGGLLLLLVRRRR